MMNGFFIQILYIALKFIYELFLEGGGGGACDGAKVLDHKHDKSFQ